MQKMAISKRHALEDWRVTSRTSYAPSPYAAGLCLIGEGIKLMAGDLKRMPRRTFFRVQAGLVYICFGVHNYPHRLGVLAWLYAGTAILLYGLASVLLGSVLSWLTA